MAMTFKRDEGEEGYEEYDAYAALNRQSLLRKPYVPYIAAGIVAFVVIVGFAIYGSGSQNDALAEEVALLGKRIEDLEFRIGNLEQAAGGGEDIGALRRNTEDLGRQFQSLETKLGQRFNEIEGQLSALEDRQKRMAKAAPPAPAKTAPPASPKIHVVKAGETLYQISRKYGVSVNRLQELNKMGRGVTIRPGQELVVGSR